MKNHDGSLSSSLHCRCLTRARSLPTLLCLPLSFLPWFISNVPFAIKPRGSSLKTDRPGEAGVSRDHQSCMDAAVWLCGCDKKNEKTKKQSAALHTTAKHTHTNNYQWNGTTPHFFCTLFPFQFLPFHMALLSLLSLSFPVPLPSPLSLPLFAISHWRFSTLIDSLFQFVLREGEGTVD